MPSCIVRATVADIVGDELTVSVEERGASRVLVIRGATELSLWFDKKRAAALAALLTDMVGDLDEVED